MKLFKPSWVSHDGEFFSIHNILNVGQGWANCVSYAALWRFLWTSCAQCTLLVIFLLMEYHWYITGRSTWKTWGKEVECIVILARKYHPLDKIN